MLLATIPPPPFQVLPGPVSIHMYGILIAAGAFLALQLTVKRYDALGGDPDLAERASLVALVSGFVGARIGYVIPRIDRFAEDPLSILYIWQGGLVLFGGLAAGALGMVLYLRRERGDLPAMMDAIAPALPLAQAIGRWGNYFNQELFGRPTDLPWALEVDPVPGRTAEQFPGATTFHPTFLYESLWNAVLVVVLLRLDRTGRLRRGALFFVYLVGYGVGRAWIEALRVDTVDRYLGLSRNNWIALAVVVGGIVALLWWQRRAVDAAPGEVDGNADIVEPDPGDGEVDREAQGTPIVSDEEREPEEREPPTG